MTNPVSEIRPGPPDAGLLVNASRILRLAQDVRDAQRVATQSDNFSERRSHVSELVARLAPLAATQRVLAEADIPFPGSPRGATSYTDTAEQFKRIRLAFRDHPETVFEDPFRDAKERAEIIATGLERRLREGWAAYVESVVQTPGSEQLDVFAKIPEFQSVARSLQALYASRATVARTLPTTAEAVCAPRTLADLIEVAWTKLGGDAPPAVLALLQAAVTTAGAPLDALTDDVHRWVDERGLAGALRIRLTS